MASGTIAALDRQLELLFSGWNSLSTLLAVSVLGVTLAPLFLRRDPDIHPFLLARQSSASAVRQPGESAVHRATDVPHGYPLRRGLNVRDPGIAAWNPGRDGDLRDVWQKVLSSAASGDPLRILSVQGNKPAVSHSLQELTSAIVAIGTALQQKKVRRIAIYLPNSVEFLIALFASSFYDLEAVLIPPAKDSIDTVLSALAEVKADALITAAGALPPEAVTRTASSIKHTILVVEPASRHVGFDAEPQKTADTLQWHEIVEQASSQELPASEKGSKAADVVCVSMLGHERYEIAQYTQNNIVAAIAAQLQALPMAHRLDHRDLVLSLDSLAYSFPLIVTMAALYSQASIALTLVTGTAPDYDLAFQQIKPTVLIASAETMAAYHARAMKLAPGLFGKLHRSRQALNLAAGAMPQANSWTNALGPRLIYTSAFVGGQSVPLSSLELCDLRLVTGARIIYALTAPTVAGAVAQTHMLDYRPGISSTRRSHFGPPLSSLELKLVQTPQHLISDDADESIVGQLVASGPAVVNGEAKLDATARFENDGTLRLV